MKKQILLNSIQDIQRLQRAIVSLDAEAGLHNEDGSVIADAKTFLGLWSLDFSKPVYLVSENEALFRLMKNYLKEEAPK